MNNLYPELKREMDIYLVSLLTTFYYESEKLEKDVFKIYSAEVSSKEGFNKKEYMNSLFKGELTKDAIYNKLLECSKNLPIEGKESTSIEKTVQQDKSNSNKDTKDEIKEPTEQLDTN